MALQETLRAAWGDRDVTELGSDNVVALHEFRKTYAGMGRTNGDREREALAAVPADTKVISMGGGMPEHALLPFEEIQECAKVAWERDFPSPLEYGSSALLKEGIGSYLERTRGVPVPPEELHITTGNQGGIKLACDAYLGPGDVAIIESPLWTSTVTIAKGCGADPVAVGMDREGIDVAEIETEIDAAAAAGKRVKMIYCQPLFHNPSGVTISRSRAEALLQLAAKHGIVIVADEAYEAYLYAAEKPVYLSALSGGLGVLSIHTFSKTLGTGLRVGYIHGAAPMLAPIKETSLTQASVMLEYAVGELMASGRFDAVVDRARASYASKLDTFCAALEAAAGEHVTINKPAGGFFVWMQCNSLDSVEVQLKMTAKGVMAGVGEHYFGPGKHDRGPGETHGGHIRMAFIGASEEDLVDAAGRIGQACAELAAEVPVEAASVATSGASGSSARL